MDTFAFCSELADCALELAARHFRGGGSVDAKADRTPVTAADRAIESTLRERIGARFPDHGILGEEFPPHRPDAEWLWVIDPIDGTKSFASGRPTFGTLIALLHRGRPVVGAIQAGTGERWIAAEGRGTTHDGVACRVRGTTDLSQAVLYTTTPEMFPGRHAERFGALRDRVQWTSYGGDCYAYGLLAAGYVDLVVERDLKPYDFCALVPVVENAGGVITDWNGDPLSLQSGGDVVAAATAGLAAATRAVLIGG